MSECWVIVHVIGPHLKEQYEKAGHTYEDLHRAISEGHQSFQDMVYERAEAEDIDLAFEAALDIFGSTETKVWKGDPVDGVHHFDKKYGEEKQ